MTDTAKAVRNAVKDRMGHRPVKISAASLSNGQAIQYDRLTGGTYIGIVIRIWPRRGEIKVRMWSALVRHRDGTYGRGKKGLPVRTDIIRENQIRGLA